jgi:hypothetical protein
VPDLKKMVDVCDIETISVGKFVVHGYDSQKRRELLHTVPQKFGPEYVGKWILKTQITETSCITKLWHSNSLYNVE